MVTMDQLNDRERQILRMLIEHFVTTAEPVGSRVLAMRYGLGISAATIRNTMQDLETRGLIRQPHTSAGRVPTDEGYRQYVEDLLDPKPVPKRLADRLRDEIANVHSRAVDEILDQTAHVLASVTSQIGVTLAPSFEQGVISRIELVPVAERRMLLVLGIESGLARTILLEVSAEIDPKSVESTERALNDRLVGQPLSSLKTSAPDRLRGDQRADARLVKMFFDAADDLTTRPPGESLHVNGTSNLFAQPEFADHEALSGLLRVIEQRTPLIELLQRQGMGEGIVVTIGREAKLAGAEGCSLVSANYTAGQVSGTIGVVGPTRMEYAKLVSIVDYVAKLLSEQMES